MEKSEQEINEILSQYSKQIKYKNASEYKYSF